MVELLAFDIEVKKFGNSAHLILPKELVGERVDIVRRGLAPHFSLEFRTEGAEEPSKRLTAQMVSPQMGPAGYCNAIVVRGAYGPNQKEVSDLVRRLSKGKEDPFDLLVLKDGHTPVAHVKRVRVMKDTVRLWGTGFTFTLEAEPDEVLEPDLMSPAVTEQSWKRQIRD
jgi:hypothetical protein